MNPDLQQPSDPVHPQQPNPVPENNPVQQTPPVQQAQPAYAPPPIGGAAVAAAATGNKSYLATWLFAWLLGTLGIDRFYLGKIGTGILKLITLGGFGIWYLIDLILLFAGSTKDKHGNHLKDREKYLKLSVIITIVLWIISLPISILWWSNFSKNATTLNNGVRSSFQQTTILNKYVTADNNITTDVNNISSDINNNSSSQKVQDDCRQLKSDVSSADSIQRLNNAIGEDYGKVVTDASKLDQDCNSIVSNEFSSASQSQYNTDLSNLTSAQKSLASATEKSI